MNRELHTKTGPDASTRSTRHLELELPAGVAYRAGDHLGVVPRNAEALVQRVAARFGLDPAASVRLRLGASRKTFLPVDRPIRVGQLLGDYVELQDLATRKQIQGLAAHTECPWTRPRLLALAGDDEGARTARKSWRARKSLVDLLEEFPACQLPFNRYLEMLPPLRPRYYSISSSPLQDERRCSITVAVVGGPARSGRGTFQGVCSSYLLRQPEGGQVHAFVKDTKSAFRLPADSATPIIMVGPGTGLAPFRGFLQERAARRVAGETVGPALLFFGCRHPRQDFIYEDELRGLRRAGRGAALRVLLPAGGRAEDLRAGPGAAAGRGGLEAPPGGGGRLRLRGREPDGPRRAARVRGDPPPGDGERRALRRRPGSTRSPRRIATSWTSGRAEPGDQSRSSRRWIA